jgi:GR25 family glycosyltransferase involved in LPS biosynthesis
MKYEIYVINLDRSKDRWKRIEQSKLNIKRFSATDGSKLSKEEINKIDPYIYQMVQENRRDYSCDHVKGSFGCYFSHIKLIEEFIKNDDLDYIVICEDDIDFDINFDKKLKKIILSAPYTWGLIGLGKHLPKIWGKSTPPTIKIKNGIIFTSMAFLLAHGYIINKNFAKLLIEKAFPIKIQYDWFLASMACKFPKSCWYTSTPIIFKNKLSKKSDIRDISFNQQKSPIKLKEPKSLLESSFDRPGVFTSCNVDYHKLWYVLIILILVVVIIVIISTVTSNLQNQNYKNKLRESQLLNEDTHYLYELIE